ncbi:MAG: nitroreductase family protein [Candidatus Geothermarchaeales archaeon]
METFECIRKRRAIRDFTDEPVPRRDLTRILEAARLSPSSKNTQPWHFIVIREKETLKTLAGLSPTGKHISEASLAVAIVMDNAKLPEIDGTRAVQNMVLAAWEAGLGTCWIANWAEVRVKKLLGVPQDLDLLTILPFGYPTVRKVKSKKMRKPLAEITHGEKFGQPLREIASDA